MMPLRQPRTHFFRVIYLCLQVKTEKGENLYAQKSDKFPRVTVKCHMVGNDGGEQELCCCSSQNNCQEVYNNKPAQASYSSRYVAVTVISLFTKNSRVSHLRRPEFLEVVEWF